MTTPATVADASLPHLPRAVGYRHTMDNTEGLKGNTSQSVFTTTKANPFGVPGLDYSASYPVTTKTLFTADQMKAYARAAIAHATPVGANVAAIPTWQERIRATGLPNDRWNWRAVQAAHRAEIRDLRAALAGAPAETQCKWPNCLPEHEQQKLAAQVHGELYSGAPAETVKAIGYISDDALAMLRSGRQITISVSPKKWMYNDNQIYTAQQIGPATPSATFKRGTIVRKKSGSEWEGTIVGTYSSSITPDGYAVESSTHRGSVQIYPVSALEVVKP